jgi:hypothetical protein
LPIVLVGGLWNRISAEKGIGWQFIRFNVIAMSLPLIGLLTVNHLLSSEVSTLIAALVGYAFGKSGEGNDA